MKLQQLRFLVEVAKSGLNVSQAAERLHTSQPGVSKQVRLLEDELGLDIFVRNGKRVVGITEGGRRILEIAERVLIEADNLRAAGREAARPDAGTLVVATTHTQARYRLPAIIARFRGVYPDVRFILHQGNPVQVAEEVVAGRADLAIATEALDRYPDLVMLPCYQWNRVVVAPKGHSLLEQPVLTLEQLARWPLLSYDSAFTGQSRIHEAFARRELHPDMVLTALDADVIKTYVRLGMGVGIIAAMAFDADQDHDLGVLDAGHLFTSSTTRIAIRRGAYLRRYTYAFIESFASHLDAHTVDLALRGHGEDPGL
ncbi:MAG: CysB family HTH-type transcriptional regulator [Pseudomonadota bacterium]|nr:CysB family HTH-type transcriptional regulator [Pseudomonadota bacterium]